MKERFRKIKPEDIQNDEIVFIKSKNLLQNFHILKVCVNYPYKFALFV